MKKNVLEMLMHAYSLYEIAKTQSRSIIFGMQQNVF